MTGIATCKYCQSQVQWQKVNGRNIPYNLDGTVHSVLVNGQWTCSTKVGQTAAPVAQPTANVNPFAPTPTPAAQPIAQPAGIDNGRIEQGLIVINNTLTNGLLAILREARTCSTLLTQLAGEPSEQRVVETVVAGPSNADPPPNPFEE